MTLVRCDEISIEFGDKPILTQVDFAVEEGEKVCLIGRNGAGKSTLMKIIAGSLQPDRGEIHYRQHARISQLEQQLPEQTEEKVVDFVGRGLSEHRRLIEQYRTLVDNELDESGLKQLEDLQGLIETHGGWQPEKQIETVMTQLELPANERLCDLSGGWRRRVSLGKALVCQPDLLLLDEPTNHLDIATIEWLEHTVRGYQGAVVFITHDRNFMSDLATRMVEVDRGKLFSWPGNYTKYLELKAKANEEEDQRNALFDKRLDEEEAWIRQGVKARRTRNEGRVRSLLAMREEYAGRLKRERKAKIHIETGETSGRKVIEARSICHAWGGRTLLDKFNIKVMRGDRIGIIGNNGVGKSTLLKVLLGQMTPDQGSVKMGTNLEVGYFDQLRRELEWEKSVAHNVGHGKEYIKLGGKERHVIGYLRNFLFSPQRAMTPVKYLSGGECNRVLLAKLFTQPNNLLVLDEPTNDLDVEMLEVLEEQLVQYEGTLLIVSHDREFLDNVVTSVLVFEDNGKVESYVGGYSDWVKYGKQLMIAENPQQETNTLEEAETNKQKKTTKLSYKLQRELDMLPGQIEELEAKVEELQAQVASPKFYDQPFDKTQPVLDQLTAKQQALDSATERWLELEEMQQGLTN